MQCWKAVKTIILTILIICISFSYTACTQKAVIDTAALKKQDTVTLRVAIFDRGNTPPGAGAVDNCFLTNWIQENFGDPNNIYVEFVPIPRDQEINKLNQLMAASSAPDIVFTYNPYIIYNYIQNGELYELTDILNEYGKNLKSFLGDELLEYGMFDGKQYVIPAKRMIRGKFGSYIRKDWLDKLGLPVPQTTQEMYETLKQFKLKDPGNVGLSEVVPFGTGSGNSPGIRTVIDSFIEEMTEEQLYTLPVVLQPGYKDGVRFLNKLYNEGLISPKYPIDNDGSYCSDDIINGKVGFFMEVLGTSLKPVPGIYNTLKSNVPEAELVVCNPFTNSRNKRPKLLYGPDGMFIFIPKSSERLVEAIKYLDWMSRPDVLNVLQNGIEGKHHVVENGIAKIFDNEETKNALFNSFDITIIVNGKYYDTIEKSVKAEALSCPGYEDLFIKSYEASIQDGYTITPLVKYLPSEVKYTTILAEERANALIRCITASPEDFDQVFEKSVEEYMEMGGREVMEEAIAVYNASKLSH